MKSRSDKFISSVIEIKQRNNRGLEIVLIFFVLSFKICKEFLTFNVEDTDVGEKIEKQYKNP